MPTKTIRWVLAHEPQDIFLRAAEKFADQVYQASNGELAVEILSLGEYSEKYNNGVTVFYPDLIKYMSEGKLEMTQMYTHALGRYSSWFRALDLPFLFTDDDHASRVLDGPIGQKILNTLHNKPGTKNVKGLSFTYSGGFTVISTNRAIRSIEDLQGLKVRVPHSPVIQDYFEALGMEPVMLELTEIHSALVSNKIDAAEITYKRLYGANAQDHTDSILHSNHNMFLTSILVSQDFWSGLSEDLQQVIAQSALVSAQYEREDSIKDDLVHRQLCLDNGINVTDPDAEIQKQFRDRATMIYTKYTPMFGQTFIDKIKSA
jgi:TRAP-type C4-dicarboxylate transport system substrate-binding protein